MKRCNYFRIAVQTVTLLGFSTTTTTNTAVHSNQHFTTTDYLNTNIDKEGWLPVDRSDENYYKYQNSHQFDTDYDNSLYYDNYDYTPYNYAPTTGSHHYLGDYEEHYPPQEDEIEDRNYFTTTQDEDDTIDRQAQALLGLPLGNFGLILASVVVGSVSVTGLAYLDATRRIDDKQKQIDALTSTLIKQEDAITSQNERISELSTSIGGFETMLKTLSDSITSQATDVATLKTDVTALQATQTTQGNSIMSLTTTVQGLSMAINGITDQASAIMTLQTDVADLKTAVTPLATAAADITTLQTKVTALEMAVGSSTVAMDVATLKTDVAALKTSVTTLQTVPASVTALTTKVTNNCNKIKEVTDVTGTVGTGNDAILTSILDITSNTC